MSITYERSETGHGITVKDECSSFMERASIIIHGAGDTKADAVKRALSALAQIEQDIKTCRAAISEL